MTALPRRVMAFLFADMEGSTRLLRDLGPDYTEVLSAYRDEIETAVAAAGGETIDTQGDGHFAGFPTASGAVSAAAAAQRALDGRQWPGGVEVRARMGLHIGEVLESPTGYVGLDVHRAARIAAAAHGGQVLLSQSIADLVRDELPFGAQLVDLGSHEFKDLGRSERVFQLCIPGLNTAFPPIRSLRSSRGLPVAVGGFVGREEDIAGIGRLLSQHRLITLTGVGGVGKTRLAVAVAERAADEYDLLVFADLSLASDEAEVLPTLTRALDLTLPTHEAVAIALTGRRALLVLDNCEHVLDAAADMVLAVLGAAPLARVLATSREGLAIAGEQIVAVAGLASADEGSPAVALFADRAHNADSNFTLDEDNLPAVIELCKGLDGLPLAIELAAARVAVLTPQALVERLDQRLHLLTGGRRRRSRDRHRTLRETIDWSYQLLEPDEQVAFARLSVFAGSFSLEGAIAILDERGEIEVLDLVEALVDKSLLTVARVEGARRYRYLETIRGYAEEALDASGHAPEVINLLQGYLAGLVRAAVDELFTASTDAASRIRLEIPNMRRALDHALAAGDVGGAAALIAPLIEVWALIDWGIDGWADEILQLPEAESHAAEPVLMGLRAVDTWHQGRFGAAQSEAERLLDAALRTGAESAPWWAHMLAAGLYAVGGNDQASAEQGAKGARAGASAGPDVALYCRLWHLPYQIHRPAAEVDADLALASGHPSSMLKHLAALARAYGALLREDYPTMLEAAIEASALGIEGSGMWFSSLHLHAGALLKLGRINEAVAATDVDLDHAYRYGNRSDMVIPVVIYALTMQLLGDAEAAATIRGSLPRRLTLFLVDELAGLDRWLEQKLGADRMAELMAAGRAMGPADLKTLAHEAVGEHADA